MEFSSFEIRSRSLVLSSLLVDQKFIPYAISSPMYGALRVYEGEPSEIYRHKFETFIARIPTSIKNNN